MNLTKYARATIWIYFGTPGAATHVQKSSTDRGIDFGKSWGPNWSRKKLKKQYPGHHVESFWFPGGIHKCQKSTTDFDILFWPISATKLNTNRFEKSQTRGTVWSLFGTPEHPQLSENQVPISVFDSGLSWGPTWSRKNLKKDTRETIWNHFATTTDFVGVGIPILIETLIKNALKSKCPLF